MAGISTIFAAGLTAGAVGASSGVVRAAGAGATFVWLNVGAGAASVAASLAGVVQFVAVDVADWPVAAAEVLSVPEALAASVDLTGVVLPQLKLAAMMDASAAVIKTGVA